MHVDLSIHTYLLEKGLPHIDLLLFCSLLHSQARRKDEHIDKKEMQLKNKNKYGNIPSHNKIPITLYGKSFITKSSASALVLCNLNSQYHDIHFPFIFLLYWVYTKGSKQELSFRTVLS